MTVRDDATPWVDGLTVGEVLRKTSARFGDSDAVVFPSLGLRWSWSELDRRVDRAASALIELGVKPGEHVGMWAMNCPEWVLIQFATARIGAVLVNVNPAYRLHELEDSLAGADVTTLVVGCPFKTSNFVEMVETLVPEIVKSKAGTWRSARLPELRRAIAVNQRCGPGWLSWSDLENAGISDELRERERRTRATDVCDIQFTSGTTGMPKGAMLTHRNILMNAYYIGQRVRFDERDRVCVPVPFYHCFGCVLGTAVCLVYGSALVVPAPSFDPIATLETIAGERCTAIYGVPTMFVAQLDHPDRAKYDLTSLRTGIMAGSPCPLPVMEAVINTLGAKQITIGYGLTEASPIITQTNADDSIEVRVGTIGRPLPGVEVRLIDPKTRLEVKPGETGELCASGHGIMVGYYKNPEATAKAVGADGFLRTGDLARRREDGNYRIVGRAKELIIRGGENIYPPEIEEYLHRHPRIADVAIVGLPDKVYGEVVSAWIVPKQGETVSAEDVRDFCRGEIAHFKIPCYIKIVDQLPRTVTGKTRKHILRQMGIDEFGLAEIDAITTA